MWQLTFAGSITDEKDIPNDISDLLKETEKSLETSLSVCSFKKKLKLRYSDKANKKIAPSDITYKWNLVGQIWKIEATAENIPVIYKVIKKCSRLEH